MKLRVNLRASLYSLVVVCVSVAPTASARTVSLFASDVGRTVATTSTGIVAGGPRGGPFGSGSSYRLDASGTLLGPLEPGRPLDTGDRFGSSVQAIATGILVGAAAADVG